MNFECVFLLWQLFMKKKFASRIIIILTADLNIESGMLVIRRMQVQIRDSS